MKVVWMGLEGASMESFAAVRKNLVSKHLEYKLLPMGNLKKNINISDIIELNFSQKSNYKN